MGRRAIFFDRDGTLCEESHGEPSTRLRLVPGAPEAVQAASRAGFQTVVVTNQSAVARGRIDENELADLHLALRDDMTALGARIDGIYHCPHHPSEGNAPYRQECACRKPGSGMLLRAHDEMGVDLTESYVIGDRYRDLAAGAAVGCTPLLVLTGYGKQEHEAALAGGGSPASQAFPAFPYDTEPAHVAVDVAEAVRWVVDEQARRRTSADTDGSESRGTLT